MSASLTDYLAAYEPDGEVFRAAIRLAEKVNGTLGLTTTGRLVISLQEPYTAQAVSAAITNDDFPYGYVVPGTDSILVFEF